MQSTSSPLTNDSRRGTTGRPLKRFLSGGLWCALPFLATSLASFAKADERSAEDWAAELSATFAKHSGHIATYEARSGAKRVTGTIGTDRAEEAFTHVVTSDNGKTIENRSWREDDCMNMQVAWDDGAKTLTMPGVRKSGEALAAAMRAFELESSDDIRYGLEPYIYLTEQEFASGLVFFQLPSRPPWLHQVKSGSVVEVGDAEVVFRTEKLGDMTISRETGMLVRQICGTGDDGKPRELKLVKLELDPGTQAVGKFRNGWSAEDSEESSFDKFHGSVIMLVFQQLLDRIDREEVSIDRLRELLEVNADLVRSSVRHCLATPDSETHEAYEKHVKEHVDYFKAMAAYELDQEPGGLTAEEKKRRIKEMLEDPNSKIKVRDAILESVWPKDSTALVSTVLATADSKSALTAATPHGEKALVLMGEALAHAQFEARAADAIEKFW
jgi:hypothetical protein